jgi:two-component system LytT family sensor kinase
MLTVVPLKINKSVYHLGFWSLAYLFWVYIFRNNTLVLAHAITIQFCYLVFIAANYYFNSLYTIPRLLNRKKYLSFAAAFLGMIVATAWLRVPVSYWVHKYLFRIDDLHFNMLNVFYESFINIFFWIFFIVAAKMMIDRVHSQVYIEQIEKEKTVNELNFLRAQFNPHFLFNSINSIYGYIDKSNKEARDILLTFSDMLRYQLYECNVERIDMERELKYIKNYIALQKLRLNEQIQVQFIANNLDNNIQVSPLILITFIENAFKYVGFNEGSENRIEICLDYKDGNLKFRVFNTKDNFVKRDQHSSGLGIANTKRRLELLYPGNYSLDILDTSATYTISLNIFDV